MAPLGPRSGCGHVVTTNGRSLRPTIGWVRSRSTGPGRLRPGVLHRFGPGIDWVFSGINAGGNLGADLHHSGTVAAVREAAIHGIRGIAVSHYIARGRAIDWDPRRAGRLPACAS